MAVVSLRLIVDVLEDKLMHVTHRDLRVNVDGPLSKTLDELLSGGWEHYASVAIRPDQGVFCFLFKQEAGLAGEAELLKRLPKVLKLSS